MIAGTKCVKIYIQVAKNNVREYAEDEVHYKVSAYNIIARNFKNQLSSNNVNGVYATGSIVSFDCNVDICKIHIGDKVEIDGVEYFIQSAIELKHGECNITCNR